MRDQSFSPVNSSMYCVSTSKNFRKVRDWIKLISRMFESWEAWVPVLIDVDILLQLWEISLQKLVRENTVHDN